MITAAMMNEAVTGTARPTISTATAEKIAVSASEPPAASTISDDSSRPRPVSETTATMMPAAAHVAAIGSTPRAPATSASQTLRGPIRSRLSRNESRNASTVANSTARNGEKFSASSSDDQRTATRSGSPSGASSFQKPGVSRSSPSTSKRRVSASIASRIPR